MDIGRVLARSLEITWKYKFLWVLGIVFALFGGGGSSYSPGNNFNFQNPAPFRTSPVIPPNLGQQITALVLFILCFVVIWLLLTLYFRFVSRGALVAAVRDIENGTGSRLGAAWRAGQSYWGRLLGLGLLVNIPLWIFSLLLIGLAILPLLPSLLPLLSQAQSGTLPSELQSRLAGGILGAVALFCCAILCLILVDLIIYPIYQFAVRAIVVENLGPMEGLRRGYNRLRANVGTVALVYLALIGIRIAWGLALLAIGIPVGILIVALVAAMARQSVAATIIAALVVGIPVGLVFVVLEGIYQVFEQTVWTESYLAVVGGPTSGTLVPAAPDMPSPAAPPVAPVETPPPAAPAEPDVPTPPPAPQL